MDERPRLGDETWISAEMHFAMDSAPALVTAIQLAVWQGPGLVNVICFALDQDPSRVQVAKTLAMVHGARCMLVQRPWPFTVDQKGAIDKTSVLAGKNARLWLATGSQQVANEMWIAGETRRLRLRQRRRHKTEG